MDFTVITALGRIQGGSTLERIEFGIRNIQFWFSLLSQLN